MNVKEDKCTDFPLHVLHDKKSEMYAKFAKIMIIFQGPYTNPRKRSYEDVKKIFKSCSRVLSDETYKLETRNNCMADTTDEFYSYLKEEVRNGLETGYNLIYIDSTLSKLNQNQYYISVANKMQYVVLIMPPVVTDTSSFGNWPRGSQADSFKVEHDIRIPVANMFRHLFCGWFLHDIDSEELRNYCALYANDLFEGIPEFAKWFSKIGDAKKFVKHFKLIPEDTNKEEMVLREDIAFCPVKVFSSAFVMADYFEQPAVIENYGKMSKLHIVGFVISPYMVAARVKLTHKQKDLWDADNDKVSEEGRNNCMAAHKLPYPTELYNKSKADLPKPIPDVKRICSKSNTTLIKGEYSHEPSELIPPFAKGRTCHIVLGTSPEASAADVDYGVAFAVNRVNKALKDKVEIDNFKLDKCIVQKIGKYWLIFLNETLIINGLFASCVQPCDFDMSFQSIKKLKK